MATDGSALTIASLDEEDDALAEAAELADSWKQRLTLNNLALAERYLKGKLEVCLIFLISGGGADAEYGCAILKRIQAIRRFDIDAGKLDWFSRPWGDGLDGEMPVRGPYRNDGIVFIENVEVMDNPKGIAPAFVWLKPLNQAPSPRINSIYFFRGLSRKFAPSVENRKTVLALDGVGAAMSAHGIADSEVKGGANVVDDVAEDGAKLRGHLLSDIDAEKLIARFRVVLG